MWHPSIFDMLGIELVELNETESFSVIQSNDLL
jgi:hypothetical protein